MSRRTGILVLFLAFTAPAFAYLDPVTGNILVQGLMAAVAAVAIGFHRIKAYVNSKLGKDSASSSSKANEQPKEDTEETRDTENSSEGQ